MASLWSVGRFFAAKEIRILVVGLDAAGKKTLLYQLKSAQIKTVIPTIGCHLDTVQYRDVALVAWQVSGRDKSRALWSHCLKDTVACVFVVDSSDQERFSDLREEMQRVLGHDELRDAVVLIFANKQDIPGALRKEEMIEVLCLNEIKQKWHVEETSAINKTGINEGLDWLVDQLRDVDKKKPSAWGYLTSPMCWLTSWWNDKPKSDLVT